MKKHRIPLLCLAAALLLPFLLLAFSGCNDVRGEKAQEGQSTGSDQATSSDEDSLPNATASDEPGSVREVFHGYSELNPDDGIDIIVWQMSANSYSFGMLPHKEGRTNPSVDEWTSFKGGLDAEQMRKLIAEIGIDKNDVTIIPCGNPLSSYISLYMVIFEGENEADRAARIQEFVLTVEKMLFGDD